MTTTTGGFDLRAAGQEREGWTPTDGGDGETLPAPPPTETARIALREAIPSDYPVLYRLAMDPAWGYRWRYRSRQLLFDEFVQSLREGVLCQFVVLAKPALEPIGLVICYNADFRNRRAYLAMHGAPAAMGSGLVMEGGRLLVDHLFACFDFDKLYAECPEFSMSSYRHGLGEVFVEEGRLRDYERYLGRSWDLSILAIHRSAWAERFRRHGPGRPGGPGPVRALRPVDGVAADFASFAACVEDLVPVPPGVALRPESRLVDDLGLDSISVLQIVELLEESGVVVENATLAGLQTLGDVHFALVQGSS